MVIANVDRDRLRAHVRDIPDFPAPGVMFRDVTPLMADHDTFVEAVDAFAGVFAQYDIDVVVGIEARGFIFGAPVAYRFGAGFVPVRKAGKLPGETRSITYDLEYGTETLELHEFAIEPAASVLIIDDVLATGGTAAATAQLIEQVGAEVVGLGFLVELTDLNGAAKLDGYQHLSLLKY